MVNFKLGNEMWKMKWHERVKQKSPRQEWNPRPPEDGARALSTELRELVLTITFTLFMAVKTVHNWPQQSLKLNLEWRDKLVIKVKKKTRRGLHPADNAEFHFAEEGEGMYHLL